MLLYTNSASLDDVVAVAAALLDPQRATSLAIKQKQFVCFATIVA